MNRKPRPQYLVRVTVDGSRRPEWFYSFAGLVADRSNAHTFQTYVEAQTIANLVNDNPGNSGTHHATVIDK